MIMEAVLKEAEPCLKGRTVSDLVVGISLIAAELDNGSLGVSYVLREGLQAGCSIFPYAQEVIGEEASCIAGWAVSGGDYVQKAIGFAVLGAASRALELEDAEKPGYPFGIEIKKTDTVGMIGYIKPVARMLMERTREVYIFDRGISICGGERGAVLPEKEQPRLLPECDVVLFSGTSLINGTTEKLLKMCSRAREVVMVGSTTPMFPRAFRGTGVTVLAGSWWKSGSKEEIFKKISLAGGISSLREYAIKKSVRVPAG
ncbi:MAG: DUF364 domain-containing protein [Firmicutes bacterium]|nr:DUF364 domain-containing protein [Bacillota bacterium]